MRQALLLVLILNLSTPLFAVDKKFGRDSEAIYLEDLSGLKKIKVTALRTAGMYGDRKLRVFLGNLVEKQEAILLAYHQDAYLIQIPNKNTNGWVRVEDIVPLSPELIVRIAEKNDAYQKFSAAMEEKRVLPGMTLEQVVQMLGKPDQESFRIEESARYDSISYITYERKIRYRESWDPYYRRYVTTSYVEKVPVGSTDIEFKDGYVTSMQQNKDNNSRAKHRISSHK